MPLSCALSLSPSSPHDSPPPRCTSSVRLLPTEDRHARAPPPALLSRARRQLVDVRGQMLGEVVGPGEALAARLAVVRPLAGVDAQVARQVGLAAERAPTEQADERPLAGVLADVQLQVFLRPDALAAERAGEPAVPLLLGRVHPQKVQDGGFLRIEPEQPVVRYRLRVDQTVERVAERGGRPAGGGCGGGAGRRQGVRVRMHQPPATGRCGRRPGCCRTAMHTARFSLHRADDGRVVLVVVVMGGGSRHRRHRGRLVALQLAGQQRLASGLHHRPDAPTIAAGARIDPVAVTDGAVVDGRGGGSGAARTTTTTAATVVAVATTITTAAAAAAATVTTAADLSVRVIGRRRRGAVGRRLVLQRRIGHRVVLLHRASPLRAVAHAGRRAAAQIGHHRAAGRLAAAALVRARHGRLAVGGRCSHPAPTSLLAVEPLERVVQPVLLERLQVAELHAAHVAGEELVGRDPAPAATAAGLPPVMLRQHRPVPAAGVPALLPAQPAQVRLVVVDRQVRVLQGGVLLQQPDGREVGHADVTLGGVGAGRCCRRAATAAPGGGGGRGRAATQLPDVAEQR